MHATSALLFKSNEYTSLKASKATAFEAKGLLERRSEKSNLVWQNFKEIKLTYQSNTLQLNTG